MIDIDLFAGPGGWDVAARELGMEVVGLEWDDAACATRRAARLSTLQVDVAAMDPAEFAPVRGMIASPPCPTFSHAGRGKGRLLLPQLVAALKHVADGADPRGEFEDEISRLVLEPLRWARVLRPEWIALEQVPPALEIWKATARHLERWGYSVWTGELSAEQYGVPQTRKRAVLMARKVGVAQPPAPTHRRFRPGEEAAPLDDLFGGGLLPWVSMAQALGWTEHEVVNTRGDRKTPGGNEFTSDGPSWALTEKARSWKVNTGRDWKKGGTREDAQTFDPTEQPAPTIDGKGRWHLVPTNPRPNATARAPEEPAPTMAFGHNSPTWMRANAQKNAAVRSVDEPAPTIKGAKDVAERVWVHERPATTVQGDPRIWPPGHKINEADVKAGRTGKDRAGTEAVRVSIEQAAVLQSFPADYPWQGSRTAIFRQIGNAVPPLMARAVLAELTS